MSEAVEISAKAFESEVLKADEPVVVEFFSHSCPHCIKFNSVYKKLSEAFGREAKFLRIDVLLNDQNRSLAHSRGVRTVPTMEVFYRGRVVGNIVGYHHFEKVSEALKGFLMERDQYVGPGTSLNTLSRKHATEPMSRFTVKGSQIRWFKKTKLSTKDRQLVKKDLKSMSKMIDKALNCTKEEASENRVAEIRLPLPSHAHRDIYLTIEYCNNGWHLILESPTEIIGEIASPRVPFIRTLEESEIETDVI